MRDIKPQTDEMMIGSEVGVKKGETRKIYPRLRLEHQFFPEAKKMEVGKEYEVTLKIKMTGISISRYQNDSEFDIVGIECEGSDEKKKGDK